MTDAKVIAPFAVLHACAMALGVGMLVVLLRGTQEPRPDDSDGPAALVGSRRARDRLSDPSVVDCRSPTRSRPACGCASPCARVSGGRARRAAVTRRATGVRCAPARGTGDEHYATAQLQGCWLAGPS